MIKIRRMQNFVSNSARVVCTQWSSYCTIKLGDKAAITKTFTSADVSNFAQLSCDTNPIHVDPVVAKESRFGQCVVHGVLTVGLLSGVMGTKLPGSGSIVLSYDIVHPNPLYVNESVTAEVTVEQIQGRRVTLNLLCSTDEDKVVTKGVARLLVPKEKITDEAKMEQKLVEERWSQVTAGVEQAVAHRWRSMICSMYSEAHRHYHTLAHVADMLRLRDAYVQHINDTSAVTQAIVFHDIIYDPTRHDNEERSAQFFEQFASEAQWNERQDFTDKVVRFILATKTHVIQQDDVANTDLSIFLDLDMAVLGRPWAGYSEYMKQIRQEYIHVDDKDFTSGRSKVLESFLEMPHIYKTDILRSEFEQQARENIAKELELLKCA